MSRPASPPPPRHAGGSAPGGPRARSAPSLVYGFPGTVLVSVDDEVVHGIPGRRVIAAGDLESLRDGRTRRLRRRCGEKARHASRPAARRSEHGGLTRLAADGGRCDPEAAAAEAAR
jgi:methionine aminopeptidase